MYKRQDYQFDLPDELIAQYPSEKRDESKLLILNKQTGDLKDDRFFNIINYLKKGDCLVINNTKVIPARLNTIKKETGAKIELLLLKPLTNGLWNAIISPSKKVNQDTILIINSIEIHIVRRLNDGSFEIEFIFDGDVNELIDQVGEEPLPPYIKRNSEESDKNRYQTVYAENKGAVAAPTAGLHFTAELLEKIKESGVHIVPITLHVGLGTFRPVKVDSIQDHKMHSEFYTLSKESADQINQTKTDKSGRIIAVGTTSLRCLESVINEDDLIKPGTGETDIFIYPGYNFKCVDCLLTNFHTPESTLLMLVSAFAGFDRIKSAYQHAIEMKYRFFSYGDAMFIATTK